MSHRFYPMCKRETKIGAKASTLNERQNDEDIIYLLAEYPNTL